MSSRLMKAAEYRVMPWKNGAGSTTELRVHPAEGGVAGGFVWRISLATVAGSGPFSAFPGIDRTIVQLSGAPMTLAHAGQGKHQLTPFVPYAFRGDWETEATLLGGATDFNVMTRRGAASAQVDSLRIQAKAAQALATPGPAAGEFEQATLVYVINGELELASMSAPASPLTAEAGDSLWVDAGGSATVRGDAGVLRVALRWRR